MDQENFSPIESLKLIREMIDKTKQGMYDRSTSFLLWGWGTFIVCLSEFVLKVIFNYPYHYRVWIVMFVFAIFSRFLIARQNKQNTTISYVRESMKFLWVGIGVSFVVLILIFSRMGWQYCYPFFMLLYGLGTYVSGKLLKFRPLVYGGITSWLLAVVSVNFDYDYQMLFACASLLVSYIIPGHILRAQYQRDKKIALQAQLV